MGAILICGIAVVIFICGMAALRASMEVKIMPEDKGPPWAVPTPSLTYMKATQMAQQSLAQQAYNNQLNGYGLQSSTLGSAGSSLQQADIFRQMQKMQALQALMQAQAQLNPGFLKALYADFVYPTAPDWVLGLRKIADALSRFPDPAYENTMGFRAWRFDLHNGVLKSPTQGTIWHDAELHCEQWNETDVVRGVSGIHARFVPYNWEKATTEYSADFEITGVVERFGKYVLGTDGWRAEWVVIRKLCAPNRGVAAALRECYPDVEVSVMEKNDGHR